MNQVWSADITYVPLPGFMYLLSSTAMCSPGSYPTPWAIFSMRARRSGGGPRSSTPTRQFTPIFTTALLAANIQVSMDGRGRALDNVFCERLWRSVKYENVYLQQYDSVRQLQAGLSDYFDFYNHGAASKSQLPDSS